MFFAVLSVLFAIPIIIWYYRYNYFTKYLRGVKWNTPIPIFGNALEFRDVSDFLHKPVEMCKKNDGIAPYMVGYNMYVFLTNHDIVAALLRSTEHLEKAETYDFFKNWLGNGLFLGSIETWRHRRKAITPSYHFQILDQFVEVFNSNSKILVELLEKEVDKKSTDMHPYLAACSLDIICETAMGVSIKAQSNFDSEYVKSTRELCKIVLQRSYNPLLYYDCLYYFTKLRKKEQKCVEVIHTFTKSVIQSRKLSRVSSKTIDDYGIKRRKAFLDMLLETTADGQALTDEDILSEVNSFMFAGSDTSSSAMSFLLYCIAAHPDIQAQLLEEQVDIFGHVKSPDVSMANLNAMKFLEMVIKEAQRMYSPVPMIGRKLSKDFTCGNVTFRKGTLLVPTIYGIHNDSRYFEDPQKFDPYRFSDMDNSLPFVYIPFSAGPRNCIGQRFAMLEIKTVVSAIVRNYRLSPVVPEHKLQIVNEIVLKSANGILVRLEKR